MKSKYLMILTLLLMTVIGGELGAVTLKTQSLTIANLKLSAKVADGYRFELLSRDLASPRFMAFHKSGDLFIGSRSGQVFRLKPPYTKAAALNISLPYPHSVAFRDDQIFISSTEGVYAGVINDQQPLDIEDLKRIADLPAGRGHNSRTIKFGPDGRLYASLGISGNCSNEYLDSSYSFSRQRGGVMVLDQTKPTPVWKTWAKGLRNPVGFDWHHASGVLYASNNGPDHLGFEQPPEVFARLDKHSNMGMPWFQFIGNTIKRDHCLSSPPPFEPSEVSEPTATFPARSAPMDVLFIPNEPHYGELAGNALVAIHGSWATRPDGGSRGDAASRRPPKIVMVNFENGRATGVKDVVTGFQLENGQRWLRPVGLALGPDGAVYISSDAGVQGLFRLSLSAN